MNLLNYYKKLGLRSTAASLSGDELLPVNSFELPFIPLVNVAFDFRCNLVEEVFRISYFVKFASVRLKYFLLIADQILILKSIELIRFEFRTTNENVLINFHILRALSQITYQLKYLVIIFVLHQIGGI